MAPPIAMMNITLLNKLPPVAAFRFPYASPPTPPATPPTPAVSATKCKAEKSTTIEDKSAKRQKTNTSATKRKAKEVTTAYSEPSRRQRTAPDQDRTRKLTKNSKAAKSSRPVRKISFSSSNTLVATTSVPAQAPATVHGRAPSAISDVAPAPSPSTQQSSIVTTTQTANTASAPAASLPAPVYNPTACFTRAVPALITPWPHNFPAPTSRFTQSLPFCPINWTNVRGLTRKDIEAYELRVPWNPAPLTFTAVAQQSQHLVKGEVPSEEGVRKRFKKACLAIFKCSGVYFEGTALGLDDYGVPKQQELNRLVNKLIAKATSTAVRSAASPTITTPASTATSTHKRHAQRGVVRTPLRHFESRIYTGEVFAIQLQLDTEDDQPIIRICNKKCIRNYNSLTIYDVTVVASEAINCQAHVPALPFSPMAFDLWHASVCFGRRHTFPQRTTICKEVAEGEYQLRDNGIPRTITLGVMFETYCLSQFMGSTDASDMILDEIMRRLINASFSGFAPEDIIMLQGLRSDDPLLIAVHDFLRQAIESETGDGRSSVVDLASPEFVCKVYHNHAKDQMCYLHKAESSILFPDLVNWKVSKKDKTLMENE